MTSARSREPKCSWPARRSPASASPQPQSRAAHHRALDDTIDFSTTSSGLDELRPDGRVIDDGFDSIRDEHGTRQFATFRFAHNSTGCCYATTACGPQRSGISLAGLPWRSQTLCRGNANRVAVTLQRLFVAAGDPNQRGVLRLEGKPPRARRRGQPRPNARTSARRVSHRRRSEPVQGSERRGTRRACGPKDPARHRRASKLLPTPPFSRSRSRAERSAQRGL